jgi:hypothetical protein
MKTHKRNWQQKAPKKKKTAETMNDEWKTGTDKDMDQDKSSNSSMTSGESSNMTAVHQITTNKRPLAVVP